MVDVLSIDNTAVRESQVSKKELRCMSFASMTAIRTTFAQLDFPYL